MKYQRLLLLAIASILLSGKLSAASVVGADFTMWQEYSVGPNFISDLDPTWVDYVNNMKDAVSSSGIGSAGNPLTPGYYSTTSATIPLSHMVSTGPGVSTPANRFFNSWHGQADPGSVFGAAFAGQWGNFLYTPLLINTFAGGAITINNIVRNEYSASEDLDAPPWYTATYTTWGNSRVGVTSFGSDNALGGVGGNADTYITSGSMASTPVVAFFATGDGFALPIDRDFYNVAWPNSTPNENIYSEYFNQWVDNDYILDFRADWTVTYSKGAGPVVQGLTGGTVNVVPEPSTLGLGALACMCYLNRRRRPQPR